MRRFGWLPHIDRPPFLAEERRPRARLALSFVPFEFSSHPALQAANRVNAYNTYLLLEKESLAKEP
ncbi:hypothetical protein [Archangium violaceum]|uniref:hypothetical protein n=1 Tax=Archangium violaceum TaxID=83451 RepID=UPI0036DB3FB0